MWSQYKLGSGGVLEVCHRINYSSGAISLLYHFEVAKGQLPVAEISPVEVNLANTHSYKMGISPLQAMINQICKRYGLENT